MDLTPNDIRNYEFPTQLRGYDKETVEKFAEQVAEALEGLKQENVKLSMQLESTKGQLDGLKQFEDAIKSAAIDARCNADQTVSNAKKEAEQILNNAREEAENIISSNHKKLASIQSQLKQIGATRTSYLEKLQELMTGHLKMVEAIEKGDALALSPEEEIDVTDSSEVDGSQKGTPASADERDKAAEEISETNELADSSEVASQASSKPSNEDLEKTDTEKLKQVLAEPTPEPPKEIDPELAQALENYKSDATKTPAETTTPDQPAAPKQGEMVETTARAEDVPDGFVANSGEPAIEENSVNLDSSNPKNGAVDIASELDNVVAKFEEEMDKAAKN